MSIRMLEDRRGSPDGYHIFDYHEGETYSADSEPPVDDSLAAVFVREGWAIDPDAPAKPANRKTKVVAAAETKEDETPPPADDEPEQPATSEPEPEEAQPDASEQAPAESAENPG